MTKSFFNISNFALTLPSADLLKLGLNNVVVEYFLMHKLQINNALFFADTCAANIRAMR